MATERVASGGESAALDLYKTHSNTVTRVMTMMAQAREKAAASGRMSAPEMVMLERNIQIILLESLNDATLRMEDHLDYDPALDREITLDSSGAARASFP